MKSKVRFSRRRVPFALLIASIAIATGLLTPLDASACPAATQCYIDCNAAANDRISVCMTESQTPTDLSRCLERSQIMLETCEFRCEIWFCILVF